MKRFTAFFISVLFFAIAMASVAYAETVKVGIVDLFRSINESDSGKKAKSDLESLIKSKQSSVEEKGKALEKLKTDLEKQAAIISADAKKVKIEEIERLERDFQRLVADAQAELKKKEGELTGAIIKELREIINKTAQEEGYTLILERAEGLVLYANKTIDITDKIIKKYNESKQAKARK
jgi:outer membrane protein